MKRAGIPGGCCIAVRPTNDHHHSVEPADAFAAAWPPAPEGIADVLFGDYKPAGKLFTRREVNGPGSNKVGDAGYDPFQARVRIVVLIAMVLPLPFLPIKIN